MPEFPDADARNVLEPGCARCPELVAARARIAWGNGSLDADVMVVGEAPAFGNPPAEAESAVGGRARGDESDAERWRGGNWTGLAYTARHSGRLIRELFADAGLDADDLYFTNAVKCFPAAEDEGDGSPTNREPTADERANCRNHLATEIDQVDPAVIAATGKHATRSVLGEAAPESFVDSVLDPVDAPTFETVVVPLLHPSYQNVWLPRIGYDREEYVAAIGARVAAHR